MGKVNSKMEDQKQYGKYLPKLLTEADAAVYLGVSRQWLRTSRMNGNRTGHALSPPFVKAGKMVRYIVDDLDAWIATHRVEYTNPNTGFRE